MSENYFEARKQKLEMWVRERSEKRGEHVIKYPGRFRKTHNAKEIKLLSDGTKDCSCAGRLMAMRAMGKLAFAHIQDHTDRVQIALEVGTLGDDEYKFLQKTLDIGDYIGVRGDMFTTRKGEKTINVTSCELLSKALRPMPEKWHGLADPELKARQRYLDLIANDETRKRFELRTKGVRFIRKYLEESQFVEVETPILQASACGASARPFVTQHNALHMPLYLRIAPETYLKRLISGGYERVYELGKCFRNEGIDASHLQEFTMLEFYAAYWDFRDNMRFIQGLIQELVKEVTGNYKITYQGTTIDFSGDWQEISYRDLVLRDSGIDLDRIENLEHLKREVKSRGLDIPLDKHVGIASLIDSLYKTCSREKLIQPTFVTMHPSALVPLARRNDQDGKKLDIFQVLVNGWELVKAYSELVDPIEQRERLLEQAALAKAGDEEAMMLDEDFVLCMEYGMPPMSGLGLAIDRIFALLADAKNVRDVIYFPSLKPLEQNEIE